MAESYLRDETYLMWETYLMARHSMALVGLRSSCVGSEFTLGCSCLL